MIYLPNHFNDNTTVIIGDMVSNGCQTFHIDRLAEVAEEFNVPQSIIDEVIDLHADNAKTVEDYTALATHQGTAVRRNLARNKNVTPEAQLVLCADKSSGVRRNLAQNTNLTPEAQLVLCADEDREVRWVLAQNTNLTPEAQRVLCADEDIRVRWDLARNPNVAPEAQRELNEK
jgi:hypothetical protein